MVTRNLAANLISLHLWLLRKPAQFNDDMPYFKSSNGKIPTRFVMLIASAFACRESSTGQPESPYANLYMRLSSLSSLRV